MINSMKFIKIFLFNFFLFLNSAYAIEQFNFDVTQAEILNDGNIFKGINGGTATSADGLVISADTFEYNKILNILNAYGDVKVEDKENDQIIFTEKILLILSY